MVKKFWADSIRVGIQEHKLLEAAEVAIYPNPAREMLNIQLDNLVEASYSVRIFNITGQAVFNAELTQSRGQIDVSQFDAGR